MAQVTSAMAAKYLKKLNERYDSMLKKESKAARFTASLQENIEEIRPEYSYADTQRELRTLEEKIRVVRHAINLFNLTQTVPDFDMTIDQILVYIPQLTAKKRKYDSMRGRLPKERNSSIMRNASIIEYDYCNYDIAEAEADYNAVSDELARAQNALDIVNSTVMFEVDID